MCVTLGPPVFGVVTDGQTDLRIKGLRWINEEWCYRVESHHTKTHTSEELWSIFDIHTFQVISYFSALSASLLGKNFPNISMKRWGFSRPLNILCRLVKGHTVDPQTRSGLWVDHKLVSTNFRPELQELSRLLERLWGSIFVLALTLFRVSLGLSHFLFSSLKVPHITCPLIFAWSL